MEFGQCPICQKRGLLISPIKKVAKGRIVCQNEYYVHVNGTMVDLLMKTDRAVREEKEEQQFSAQMVLN